MCGESFLRELEETVSLSPLRDEPMELYLDQFGSLLSGPDSVGDVVVMLNPSRGASLTSVSLLDFDDEGATIDPIVPVGATGTGPTPVPAKVAAAPAATADARALEASDKSGKKTDAAADVAAADAAAAATAKTREGSARAAAALMDDDSREEGQFSFNDLGGILLPRPVNFQGPDIDPYLPWVHEVDVATMMATLNHEIKFGSAEVPLPSQTASIKEGQ
jgi:hypothetical protein